MAYDNAGNLITDTYSAAAVLRGYDAENHMTSETQANGYVAGNYTYNADGQRVRRKVNGIETWQVYGMDGELLAEYAVNADAASPQKEYGYRNGQLLITAEASARMNVAAAANGGAASAQNYTQDGVYPGLHFQPSYAIDGVNYIHGPSGDQFWRDEHGLSSWLQVDFNRSKTIDEVDVYTLADWPGCFSEPTATSSFTQQGLSAFNVQYWNGSAWVTVTGGTITGNNLAWRKINFTAVATSKIRVVANAASDSVARITEVEAWGSSAPATPINVAATANGGTASAQNYTQDGVYPGLHFQPSYAIDSVHYIHGPSGDQFWRDEHGLLSWLEVDFNGSKTIGEIDVYTLADWPGCFSEPTATSSFTQQGLTAFDVQYWNGSTWVTVTGGTITGNNLAWRKINFTAVTTSKIRVVANAASDSVARIAEVEAWTAATGTGANINWLVTDQLGTPRMIFDKTGSIAATKRHDYLPFGEELGANVGGRTPQQGYSGDSVRQKFTQKERDNETGLDYSINRYYAATQGRFTSSDPYNIFFEMRRGRDAREQAQLLRAYASEPQNWNRYSYCLNDPVNLIDPSGLIWLTQDNEKYIWIDDKDYEKNKKDYEGYSVANGAVTQYQGSSDCPQCQGLKNGDWVQLNENGGIDHVADPTVYVRDSASDYTSTTYGVGNFGMGHIVDSDARVYFTLQAAPSWPNLSYSQTTGQGPVSPGVYGQGTVGNYGLVINESFNLLHPTSGLSREVGIGSPQASAGIQVIFPACQGTTPHDWAYHPDNPNRQGLMWHPVGRSPF